MRLVLVSDTHLSPAAPEADANWDEVVRYVDDTAPDAVVHLGDLSMNGGGDVDDLRHARRQLDRLGVAWYAVPGNHDVGDNPWAESTEATVDLLRVERWVDVVGADRWSLSIDGWTLIGINAQVLGSGLDAETTQWEWLEAHIAEANGTGPVALITHKPITAPQQELDAAPPYRFVPPPARQRLAGLLHGCRLELVVSGHVHQFRTLEVDDVTHLWTPTTWAVLPDEIQPTLGAKRCGIVTLELDGDGRVVARLVEPAGLSQLTLLEDIPNP